MYSSIIVCTIAKDSLKAVCREGEAGQQAALCVLYWLRRSRVPMEVECGIAWGMLLCQIIGIVVMDPSEEEDGTVCETFVLVDI